MDLFVLVDTSDKGQFGTTRWTTIAPEPVCEGDILIVRMAAGRADDPRIEGILEALLRLASGDLEANISLSERDDEIDAIGSGINMLAEELAAQRHELDRRLQLHNTLLRELHHRVKNNLQLLVSLLRWHADELDTETGRSVLDRYLRRVQSVAAIHDLIGPPGDHQPIEFGHYVRELVSNLVRAFGGRGVRIEYDLSDDGTLETDIDTAVGLGLIVNELVTNALTHAFPGDRTGTLRISVDVGQACRVTVGDDGIGLRSRDLGDYNSLGFRLVTALADQIGAQLTVGPYQGTQICVSVPLASHTDS